MTCLCPLPVPSAGHRERAFLTKEQHLADGSETGGKGAGHNL